MHASAEREHSFHHEAGRASDRVSRVDRIFVAAAIVLAVRFWLLPDIERYRGEIVGAVSAAVGQPVRIGGIQAGWFGEPEHPAGRRAHRRPRRPRSAAASIENRRLELARARRAQSALARHRGLRLQIRRDAEGALYVAGTKLGSDVRFSRWLLAQDEVVLRNAEIEWHDERRGAPALAVGGEYQAAQFGRRAFARLLRAAAGGGSARAWSSARCCRDRTWPILRHSRGGCTSSWARATLPGAPGSTIPGASSGATGRCALAHAGGWRDPSGDGGFRPVRRFRRWARTLCRCAGVAEGRLQGSFENDTTV